MIRIHCNILWVDGGIHTKNWGKLFASCASSMMQISLRFLEWIPPSTIKKILQWFLKCLKFLKILNLNIKRKGKSMSPIWLAILIEELGLHSLPGNPTYNLTDFSASEVLDNHKSVLTSFGVQSNSEELDLPYIYWIPKIHINIDSLRVHQSVRPSLYPLYSPNCLHILSKVFRSTARQPTQEVGSIRCGSSRIQKNY